MESMIIEKMTKRFGAAMNLLPLLNAVDEYEFL